MVLPALELAPQARMDKPKIILPPSIPALVETKPAERPEKVELPSLVKAPALAPPPEPEPKPAPEPKASEKPKEPPAVEASAAAEGKKNLLALTPMPAAAKDPGKIPSGEARGRFAISPEPNLSASEKEPGSKTGISSEAIGIGNKKTDGSDEAKTPGIATGADAKSGNGKGAAAGIQGGGAGLGPQIVSGLGNSGSGAGKGTKKPFVGITIAGGSVEHSGNSNSPPISIAKRPLQTSYGLNIISTENSGGGLPFYGVFSQEQIYTVYLDMRQVDVDQDPSWTLEFAVGSKSGSHTSSGRNQQGLILPFPAEKERPAFPAEVVRKYLRKMIIVYGIVNLEGKLEQLSVKDTPDIALNEPVLKALSKWAFRPAQLNGEPVTAKLLMGIPLWLPR